MSSGGTNAKTMELCRMCEIYPDALAVGSYARKIVQDYTKLDDFLTDKEAFEKALVCAKQLVETVLND